MVATSLIEGTDGTGAKMSKSKGNYVPVAAAPGEIFGKLMSVPDRLVAPYFRALSEWRDPELAIAEQRLNERSLHPMDLKKILAGEVAAAVHGVDAAMTARDEFTARFSKRTFAEVETLPTISDLGQPIVETVKALGFAKSNKEISRIAQQHGLRVVVETDTGQEQVNLTPDEAREALATVLKDKIDGVTRDHHLYLKVGRKLARIATT